LAAGVHLVPEMLEIAENQMAVSFSAYRKYGQILATRASGAGECTYSVKPIAIKSTFCLNL
jgi:hypothetical protein